MKARNPRTDPMRAKAIQKSLGIIVAARFLKLRGYSIEAARWILLKR